jgi:hypothetical protein
MNDLARISFPLLAQFDSFQETIRYYMYRYAENKVTVFLYVAGTLVVVTVLYGILARKK